MFHSAEEHRFQEQMDRSLKASFLRCKSKKNGCGIILTGFAENSIGPLFFQTGNSLIILLGIFLTPGLEVFLSVKESYKQMNLFETSCF